MSLSVRKRFIRALVEAQDSKCCYCEQPIFILGEVSVKAFAQAHGLTYRQASKRRATIEHLRRRCEGGTHHRDNLAASCEFCNSKRGDMSWVEFKSRRTRSPLLLAMRLNATHRLPIDATGNRVY